MNNFEFLKSFIKQQLKEKGAKKIAQEIEEIMISKGLTEGITLREMFKAEAYVNEYYENEQIDIFEFDIEAYADLENYSSLKYHYRFINKSIENQRVESFAANCENYANSEAA